MQPNLCRANVVAYKLLDDVDAFAVSVQDGISEEELANVRAPAIDDDASKPAQNGVPLES